MRREEVLDPGTLRHQIAWQRRAEENTGWTGPTVTWPTLVTMRAEVRGLTGRELEAARQRWAEAQYQIRQHYYPGLRRTDRISWWIDGEERTLDVVDISDPTGMGRMQVVMAKDHVE